MIFDMRKEMIMRYKTQYWTPIANVYKFKITVSRSQIICVLNVDYTYETIIYLMLNKCNLTFDLNNKLNLPFVPLVMAVGRCFLYS